MQGREDVGCERTADELPAGERDLEVLADHRTRRCGAHRDDDVRLYRVDLALEPLVAGVDLALRRRLVQTPLAAQLPFEVLDGVGDVEVRAIDPRRLEGAVEQPSG